MSLSPAYLPPSLSLSQSTLPNYLLSLSLIHIYHTNQALFSLSPHPSPSHFSIKPLHLTTLSPTYPPNLALLPVLSLSIQPSPTHPSLPLPPPLTPIPLTSLHCLFSRSQEVTCTISSALSCMRSSLSLLMRRTASTWRSRSRLAHRSSSVRDDLIVYTFHVYRCIYYIVYLISIY